MDDKERPKVIIRKIEPADPDDERGPTYEWCRGLPGKQVSIYVRKRWSWFGNHFHGGRDPSKNPERFFLARGKVWFQAFEGKKRIVNGIIGSGAEIIIYPGILHSMRALTDVIFVEYRETEFDKSKSDTYPEEEYFREPAKKE